MQDDTDRGSDATTIRTVNRSTFLPQTTRSAHAGEIGNTIVASQLVNESPCRGCVAYKDVRADHA